MGFDRRSFLKFIAGGAVGTLFTPFPWKIADDISIWTQNWPWIPRVPKGKVYERPSIVKLGGPEYGVKVKIVNGNPILSVGNSNNWLSEGGIEPIGASCVNLLYSPARITSPLKRGSDGKFILISWNEALDLFLKKAKEAKQNTGVISGDYTGSSSEIFGLFLTALGSEYFYFMPSDAEVYDRVWRFLFNAQGQIGFDLENCELVICFGADILGSWGCVVKNLKVFSKRKFKLIYIGPYLNQTALLSEERIFIKEQDVGKFAFAIMYELIKKGVTPPEEILGFEELKNFVLKNCDPEKILPEIGVKKSDFDFIVNSLIKTKNAVVIPGSSAQNGAIHFNVFSVLCINIFLDRINKRGGIRCIPPSPVVLEKWSVDLAREKDLVLDTTEKSTKLKLSIIYRANPFYKLPPMVRSAIRKSGFIVTFSTFMDETALNSDLIIPAPHPFETYEDFFTPFGVWKATYSIAKPVIPYGNPDVFGFMSKVMEKMGIKLKVKSFARLLNDKADLLGANYSNLLKGEVWTSTTVEYPLGLRIWNERIKRLCQGYFSQNNKGLWLQPLKDLRFGSSITGILPYGLLSVREDELGKDGTMYVKLSPKTAKGIGVKAKEWIKIRSKAHEMKARVCIDCGVADGCVGILMGLGRKGWDRFNYRKGENVSDLFSLKREDGVDRFNWSSPEIDVVKI